MRPREMSTESGRQVSLAVRIAWITSCVGFLAICLGCLSVGGRTEVVHRDESKDTHSDGMIRQKGTANVPGGTEQVVYYPVPYAYPPNLEVSDPLSYCVVVEQKADHFRVKNNCGAALQASWTARGVPITTVPVQTLPTASLPSATLQPAPIQTIPAPASPSSPQYPPDPMPISGPPP